jgi:trk system potassium uptake protein TrkA
VKVIVVGGGKAVYFLSRSLLSKGHSVTVVCRNPADCKWIARRLSATVVCGDGSDPAVLDDAAAHEADAVIAASPRDPDNLVICQVADRRFGVPLTLAVVNDPDNQTVFPQLGVKNVLSVTPLVSSMVERQTAADEIRQLAVMGEGAVNVTELVLTDRCPLLGKPLAACPLPRDVLIASIVRSAAGSTEAVIPRGETVLRAGDRVVLITLPSSHGPAVKLLTGEA